MLETGTCESKLNARTRYSLAVENTMDFILGYALKFRLFQYLYRKFGGPSNDCYPCVTCGLPYAADPIDERIDNRLSDSPK